MRTQHLYGLALTVSVVICVFVALAMLARPVFFASLAVVGVIGGAWIWIELRRRHLPIAEQEHKRWLAEQDLALQQRVIAHGERHKGNIEREASGTIRVLVNYPRAVVEEIEQDPLQIEAPKDVLPTAPSFAQIVSQIRPGHLFLGQGTNGAIWGDIVDLLSTLIAGRPGTGKSTQLRNVCGQILRVQGQPVIFDPHGSIVDDLGNVFQCAETADDITDQSKWITGQLDTRLIQRRAGQAEFKPLLLLVDEMPIVASMSVLALEAIRRIVLEGRKVGMFALISGQGVPASILGGTLVRDAMSSRYVFCTSPQQARMAGIENETAKRLMALLEEAGPGKAVMATASRKPEIVAVPYTSTDDIRMLVPRNTGTLRNNSTVPDFLRNAQERLVNTPPYGLRAVTGTLANENATLDLPSPEEREQIIELARAGTPRRDICRGLGKGKWYYETVKQVLDEEGL